MAGRGRGKKAGAPRKKANGYKMPAHFPEGEMIHDPLLKKTWKIGPTIGVGGFGEIYSACEHEGSKKGSSYDYVIKIEPHENGPLFVEKHFYIRNANQEDIKNFMKSKKLASFGMPAFYGSGSHEFQGEKYRFLVLQRYGKDLWKTFLEAHRSFSASTVFQLGLQMLDVLEYIHSRGYVHADVKGANILMGRGKESENQAYLVDFGLASKVALDREFKPDPKCAHDGTIEYTSRDAHVGGTTMRGDLEILAYNMLQWIVGELPWEQVLQKPKEVQAMKEDFMQNVKSRITNDYPGVPDALLKFFEYINTLKPMDQANFAKCHQIFENYLKSEGKTRSSKLDFTAKQVKAKKATKTKAQSDDDSEDNVPLNKVNGASKSKRGRKPKQKPSESDNENELPNNSRNKVDKKVKKRKSSEPIVVASKIKKTKLTPKVTPNVRRLKTPTPGSSETSLRRSARIIKNQVTSDSPISDFIKDTVQSNVNFKNGANSLNSSGDIFDDSFELKEDKVEKKRKHKGEITKRLFKEKIVETTVSKKKTTFTAAKKGKSWKDTSAVVNGRCPPN